MHVRLRRLDNDEMMFVANNSIIQNVYHSDVDGYGSINDTYRRAKRKEPKRTLNDIKECLSTVEERQIRTKS